jgi:hypothetical protein
VERVDDSQWLPNPWSRLCGLFRYRGGLVDWWLEKGQEKSPEILQTVAMSKEVVLEWSEGFKYALIFVKYSSHQGKGTLEISHWAFGPKERPDRQDGSGPDSRSENGNCFRNGPSYGRSPVVLMRWFDTSRFLLRSSDAMRRFEHIPLLPSHTQRGTRPGQR